MKKVVIGALVLLVLLGVYFISNDGEEASNKTGADLLVSSSEIWRYQIGDAYTEYGFLSYSFEETAGGEWFAQGFVDLNDDGLFTEDEWLIKNDRPKVRTGSPSRFSFTLPEELKQTAVSELRVKLAVTGSRLVTMKELNPADGLELLATVKDFALESEFGMDVPGASEDLKRGVGATIAYAMDFEETGIDSSNLPDLSGGPMDCFAIATANNLINMATEHGQRSQLPEDTAELVGELKNFMQWNNGIINENFLSGKAAYIEALGLPITTEEILRPTIDDLADIMSSGDAYEISTTMLRSASGKANTGHVFTGVSAYQDGAEAGLAVHDPATPNGVDILGLKMTAGENPYILIEYPMWDGIMIVDAVFVQRWEGEGDSEAEESSLQLEESQTENISTGTILPVSMKIEGSFGHVKPGEYSEVYAVVTGLTRGDEVTAELYGGGHNGTAQVVMVDSNGTAHFTWRITQYDNYEITAISTSGDKGSTKVLVN